MSINLQCTYSPPSVLTIAGSDSGGGAGIQADLKTLSAIGVYGASVVTAVTAQNTQRVLAVEPISEDMIVQQAAAVLADIPIKAIKIGMLPNEEAISAVERILADWPDLPVVLDTVMVASSGRRLMSPAALARFAHLFTRVALITPNLMEAEVLLGRASPIRCREDMVVSVRELAVRGAQRVLLKGGHLSGDECLDLLLADGVLHWLPAKRIPSSNTHGTGCTLSAAIAGYLAHGCVMTDAVRRAKHYITQAIQAGADFHLGEGCGPLNHFFAPSAWGGGTRS